MQVNQPWYEEEYSQPATLCALMAIIQTAQAKPKDVTSAQTLAAFKIAAKTIAASLYFTLDPQSYNCLLSLTET